MSSVEHAHPVRQFDIIFSCTVCHCTISDAYTATDKSLVALRAGSERAQRHPVRMWLASCGHITCASHLEGGGVPFYKEDGRPKASCPICIREGDSEPRHLYALYEIASENHDAQIPQAWLQMPPANLLANNLSMHERAMLFQWSQLVTYGLAVTEELHNRRKDEAKLQTELSNCDRLKEVIKQDRKKLKDLASHLRAAQEKLQQWEERRPQVRASLDVLKQVLEENSQLRNLFDRLEFESFGKNWNHELAEVQARYQAAQATLESPFASGDSIRHASVPSTALAAGPNRKRVHSEFELDLDSGVGDLQERSSSRHAMPPPPPPPFRPSAEPVVQFYEDGRWRQSNGPNMRTKSMAQGLSRSPQAYQTTPESSRAQYMHPASRRHRTSELESILPRADRQGSDMSVRAPSRREMMQAGPSPLFGSSPLSTKRKMLAHVQTPMQQKRPFVSPSEIGRTSVTATGSQMDWIRNTPTIDRTSVIDRQRFSAHVPHERRTQGSRTSLPPGLQQAVASLTQRSNLQHPELSQRTAAWDRTNPYSLPGQYAPSNPFQPISTGSHCLTGSLADRAAMSTNSPRRVSQLSQTVGTSDGSWDHSRRSTCDTRQDPSFQPRDRPGIINYVPANNLHSSWRGAAPGRGLASAFGTTNGPRMVRR